MHPRRNSDKKQLQIQVTNLLRTQKPIGQSSLSTTNKSLSLSGNKIDSSQRNFAQNQTQKSLMAKQKRQQNFAKTIFIKYQVDEDQRQQCLKEFKQENIKFFLKYFQKIYRPDVNKQVNQFLKNQQEIANQKTQDIKPEQEFYLEILNKYKIDQKQKSQFDIQFKKRDAKQCCQYTQKTLRESMKKQLEQYFEKLENKKNLSGDLVEIQIDRQLREEIKKMNVNDPEQLQNCVIAVKNGSIQEAISFVTKMKRPEFKIICEQFLEKYSKILNKKIKQQSFSSEIVLTLNIGDLIKQITIKNGVKQLKQILKKKFGVVNIEQYSKIFEDIQIQQLQQIFRLRKKQGLLILFKKIGLIYQFNGEQTDIWVKQIANQIDIKKQILNNLYKRNQFFGESSDIHISFIFQQQTILKCDNLKKMLINEGKIIKVLVQKNINIKIYCEGKQKQYNLKSLDKISDLKNILQQDFYPKQVQCLQIQRQNIKVIIKEQQEDQLISSFLQKDKEFLQLILTNSHTTQFYGFHTNQKQTYDKFSQFTIQNDSQFIQIIKCCNFSQKNQQKIFFDNCITYIYSCIKKRFPIQTIIQKIKQIVVKNKLERIWMPMQVGKPIKMNQNFLLMYLFNNSDKRLRIQLMNLIKGLMPIPIYINKFKNIFDKNSKLALNEQIIWILRKGITVGSIGLHTQNFAKQKGKSQLLNNLFFTNFCYRENKHNIVCKIPYIAVRVYDDLFPLNIIDIPHDCDQKIKNLSLDLCDVVILNSWKNEVETSQFMKQIQNNNSFPIVLMRDCKQTSRDNLKYFNQINLNEKKPIKISNLSNYQANKGLIQILRQKINMLFSSFNEPIQNSKRILSIANNDDFQKLQQIVSQFEKKSDTCRFAKYAGLIQKDKTQKQEQFIKQLKKQKLNDVIEKLLRYFVSSHISYEISLMYFRQKLRSIQSQNVIKYMVIYKIKQKLQKNRQDKLQYAQQLQKAEKQFKALNLIQKTESPFINKMPEQISKIIDEITSNFQNNIKPNIFSVQLFWRQIYAFIKLYPNYQINRNSMFELIADLKAKEIMNNQPFEIIDGDSLEMPKEIMKKVFANIPDNCLILTIIGPQSSGKSTLLNFLFGCDFATSQGRCTRGVYGTYFRLNDHRINNFQGIFVIDTEGLFALTNDVDEKHEDRQNFDSKLVLFCLAVSDFVIINVRGNLDKNTQKILNICHEKLETLNLGEEQKPQIAIVLNQNSTSKTEESQNQFKKIRKTFNFNVSRSLSLAYSIKNYGKDQICLLAENQILTKRIPFTQFHNQTSNLLTEIINKMKKRKTAQKILIRIDKFAEIWSTILTFPNLSQMTTQQYRKLQFQIKAWKKAIDEQFSIKFKQIMSGYSSEQIDEKNATALMQKINEEYLEKFKKQYQKKLQINNYVFSSKMKPNKSCQKTTTIL